MEKINKIISSSSTEHNVRPKNIFSGFAITPSFKRFDSKNLINQPHILEGVIVSAESEVIIKKEDKQWLYCTLKYYGDFGEQIKRSFKINKETAVNFNSSNNNFNSQSNVIFVFRKIFFIFPYLALKSSHFFFNFLFFLTILIFVLIFLFYI